MTRSRSVAARALLAVSLMAGFYVLAIGTAGTLLLLCRSVPSLALFCVVGAGSILWSIIPRPDRFVAPGPALESDSQPRLFHELNAIAAAVGQEMPATVYLTPDVNAWVGQRGGMMGFGSRRVMGLGLPLLQVLTISQLRAVLAHEFGHYYGGDTRLAPWVYKTRSAIYRTMQTLARRRNVLVRVFLWYWKLFLRVTQAVSRRQELAADELASSITSPTALAEGLRSIHGASLTSVVYWNMEVMPLISAGFRPPLAEGFGRFMASPRIKESLSKAFERELREGKSTPYDSHPPLRERIAALEKLPHRDHPAQNPPAASLLENLPEVERTLLEALRDKKKPSPDLKPTTWDRAGHEVYLPLWRSAVNQYRSILTGRTPKTLPEACQGARALGNKITDPKGMLLSQEQRAQRAKWLLGAALAVALIRDGWSLHVEVGTEPSVQRDEHKITPFQVARDLASPKPHVEEWRKQCEETGISELDLGINASLDGERS